MTARILLHVVPWVDDLLRPVVVQFDATAVTIFFGDGHERQKTVKPDSLASISGTDADRAGKYGRTENPRN